jgi:hypothetical protein
MWRRGYMALTDLFKTTTRVDRPLDGALQAAPPAGSTTAVSDFLTVQSLANFAVMTAAISAGWRVLERLDPNTFSSLWVPFGFSIVFGLVSLAISWDGLKNSQGGLNSGKLLAAIFIAFINSLILTSAIIGVESTADAMPPSSPTVTGD